MLCHFQAASSGTVASPDGPLKYAPVLDIDLGVRPYARSFEMDRPRADARMTKPKSC